MFVSLCLERTERIRGQTDVGGWLVLSKRGHICSQALVDEVIYLRLGSLQVKNSQQAFADILTRFSRGQSVALRAQDIDRFRDTL